MDVAPLQVACLKEQEYTAGKLIQSSDSWTISPTFNRSAANWNKRKHTHYCNMNLGEERGEKKCTHKGGVLLFMPMAIITTLLNINIGGIWTWTQWSRSPCVTWLSSSVSSALVWPVCAVLLVSFYIAYKFHLTPWGSSLGKKNLEKQY